MALDNKNNLQFVSSKCKWLLLYSWRFSRYSAPIHWLVHSHMTSHNETVSRQLSWAGNIAETMTSNGKQLTVTPKMLTAVALDGWNLRAVFKFCFCFVLLYNKSLNDWSLGEQWRFSGNKIHCSPRDQSLSVNCALLLNNVTAFSHHYWWSETGKRYSYGCQWQWRQYASFQTDECVQ